MSFIYLRKYFSFFIRDKRKFWIYCAFSFVVGILELVGISLTYPFIMKLLEQKSLNNTSIILGLTIVFAFLLKNLLMIFYNILQADFIKNCEADIGKIFMQYFLFGNYKEVAKNSFTQKLQILGFLAPSSVNNFLIRILNLNVNVFIFLLITTFLFVKFFVATIITLLVSLFMSGILAVYFKFKTNVIANKINEVNEILNASINEPLQNLKNIKILSKEQFFYEKYVQKLENNKNISKYLLIFNTIPPYVTEPFIIILLLILLSIISIQNYGNSTTLVASYAVIISAIFRLAPTISRIQVNLTGLHTSFPQVKQLVDYYEQFNLKEFSLEKDLSYSIKSSIELKGISVSYAENKVLDDVSLKINKGDFIGIVGVSGVGKTTLADVIAGILEIDSGEILLDGNLVSTNKMPKLNIGYISQEYSLLSASIRENVAFGEVSISDERVVEVLKQVRLYDDIMKIYPEGIYALPFTDSKGFSQGQKQRLAIARILYLNPEIIILDEATSALDLKTEDEICEVLAELSKTKTLIAIAHRLSTIKSVSKLVMLNKDKSIDIGTFESLYENNAEFKQFVDLNRMNFI